MIGVMDHQRWQARKLSGGNAGDGGFPGCGGYLFGGGNPYRMFLVGEWMEVVDSILKCHIFDT